MQLLSAASTSNEGLISPGIEGVRSKEHVGGARHLNGASLAPGLTDPAAGNRFLPVALTAMAAAATPRYRMCRPASCAARASAATDREPTGAVPAANPKLRSLQILGVANLLLVKRIDEVTQEMLHVS